MKIPPEFGRRSGDAGAAIQGGTHAGKGTSEMTLSRFRRGGRTVQVFLIASPPLPTRRPLEGQAGLALGQPVEVARRAAGGAVAFRKMLETPRPLGSDGFADRPED